MTFVPFVQAWYNPLPNRDCEPGVLHYQNYLLGLCFLTSFVHVWISFLRISVDIAFWVFLQLMALQLNRGCSFS